MYGTLSEVPALEWAHVERRLAEAPLYWVVAPSTGWAHPRPVWGIWDGQLLCVSLGSPSLRRDFARDDRATVHLESGTDVVILEGRVVDADAVVPAVARYDDKYSYAYDVAAYGALLAVQPVKIVAWTAAGPAGREGFTAGGTWTFERDGIGG